MNIALIIGNGFDLNLGLPTSYDFFYKYYLTQPDGKDYLIRKELEVELSNWADLESKLGDVSIKYETTKKYIADIEHIRKHLSRYLVSVNGFIYDSDKIAPKVYDDLCDFTSYLDNPQKCNMNAFIRSLSNKDEINLDVVSFNYTSVFERIFSNWNKTFLDGKIKRCTIHHIHQRLDKGDIILGVNDPSQIANATFREKYSVKVSIIKPFAYQEYQTGEEQACQKAIHRADIIILFGISMGETDQCWWNFIGKELYSNDKRLVYCPHDETNYNEIDRRHCGTILRLNRQFSDFVIKKMSLDMANCDDIRDKIIPIRENKLFNFETIMDKHVGTKFRMAMIRLTKG